MCGIAGVLGRGATDVRERVARMAACLVHRGPDGQGIWVDESAGLALGHRRLSILDLSATGHQPMESARYVVVFNGEIYNHAELRQELGGRWQGHSDTEVMLAAFERWGVEAGLPHLDGMFALAVWDKTERRLILARDRMGEKPLYYGLSGHTFMFASELKALRSQPQFDTTIDRDAVALLMRFSCVPAPRSIYRQVRKLPPASYLVVGEGEPRAYWSLRDVAAYGLANPIQSPSEAAARLEALLLNSVRQRLVADVRVGALLSGGLDSSAVVACMHSLGGPVRTFTVGFTPTDFDEAPHARRIARFFGTDHTELYVTAADAQALIPQLPQVYDEPFADSSQIPTCLVSRMARQHVKVVLSGDGGDEWMAGYNRYVWGGPLWAVLRRIPRGLRTFAARYLVSGKVASVLRVTDPYSFYLRAVSAWTEAVVKGGSDATDPAGWLESGDIRHGMQYMDACHYLPDDILTKVDRASMASGLEVRSPFLDHRLVEFGWQVPMSMKIRRGQGKWLMRQFLYRQVPRALLDRPKAGFSVPLADWLRGPLRDWAEDLLSESRLRSGGFFDPQPIRARWQAHCSGHGNWHIWLWPILMFETWRDP